MISWSFVLERIEEELGLPFQVLERSQTEIVNYLKRNAIKKFSRFFPATFRLSLDTTDPNLQVPNRQMEYYLVDPDERTILSVKNMYTGFGEKLVLGHPWVGTFNYNQIPNYLLDVHTSMTTQLWSPYNYTTEFIPPNTLRINPSYHGNAVVEYERELSPELTDLNPELEDPFTELCLAMFMMQIGRIRRRYSNISTPFGEIQLNAEEIYSEGQSRYDQLMDRFEQTCLTNVIFDTG